MTTIEEFIKFISAKNPKQKDLLLEVLSPHERNVLANSMIISSIKKCHSTPDGSAWLDSKINSLLTEDTLENISSVLGEIRTYGVLFEAFGDNLKGQTGEGADFVVNTVEVIINIEVNTPQGRSKRREIDHGSHSTANVTLTEKEHFPFGYPERIGTDTVQGEAISKISSIKDDEEQFEDNALNILWVDFLDPRMWILDMMGNQVIPHMTFQSHITWGVIWHAFYAKKGDKIYDQLETEFMSHKPYQMEYNGRFYRSTKLDFAAFNLEKGLVIFENPNRAHSFPVLYSSFFHMHRFLFEYSFLNWPLSNLGERIAHIRETGALLSRAFGE